MLEDLFDRVRDLSANTVSRNLRSKASRSEENSMAMVNRTNQRHDVNPAILAR